MYLGGLGLGLGIAVAAAVGLFRYLSSNDENDVTTQEGERAKKASNARKFKPDAASKASYLPVLQRMRGGLDPLKERTLLNSVRLTGRTPYIDLHNHCLPEALYITCRFLEMSIETGYRRIMIITGRGIHSRGEPIIKPEVERILRVTGLKFDEKSEGGAYIVHL